jgi:hypothetical protein
VYFIGGGGWLGLVVLAVVPDRPGEARRLSDSEKELLAEDVSGGGGQLLGGEGAAAAAAGDGGCSC